MRRIGDDIDGTIADAVARATPESREALAEALRRRLARRAVACDAWEWLRGMLVARPSALTEGTERYRLIGYDNGGWQAGVDASPESRPLDLDRLQDCLPDFDDDLTAAGLLVLVRRAWVDPYACMECFPQLPGETLWVLSVHQPGRLLAFRGASELDALVSALEGANNARSV